MSGRRRVMMTAQSGGDVPTEGLLFHASFRDALIAETGQALTCVSSVAIVADAEMGRKCAYIPYRQTAIKFAQTGLPSGDSPFTIACWLRIIRTCDRTMFFGWGSTPWGTTVATIRADTSKMMALSAWTGKDTSPVIDPDYEAWHHWCGTYGGNSDPLFYRDGQLVASGSFAFGIGSGQAGFNTFWAGEIAEFYTFNARIYDRALSASEVKILANEV